MSRADVLAVMDVAGRSIMRDCDTCSDPIACVECDSAAPLYKARAAVAELIAAAQDAEGYVTGAHSQAAQYRNAAYMTRQDLLREEANAIDRKDAAITRFRAALAAVQP